MMAIDLPPPFSEAWFRFLVGLVTGVALGSFGTVLAYRLPRRLSIVVPRSHCPQCKTQLTPYDLVPVLSWIANGGRCRHCGNNISARYIYIELATGFVVGLIAVACGYTL